MGAITVVNAAFCPVCSVTRCKAWLSQPSLRPTRRHAFRHVTARIAGVKHQPDDCEQLSLVNESAFMGKRYLA